MLERIKLTMLADSHFCALSGVDRVFQNRNYRSLITERWLTTKGVRSLNVVQVANAKTLKDLKFRYADDCQSVASSVLERCLIDLSGFAFGLGDIRPDAQSLLIHFSRHGSAARIARWIKRNCEGDVLMLEGNCLGRLSFDNENDFILARLNFA